jgi:outer membrane protein assembly factor BamB
VPVTGVVWSYDFSDPIMSYLALVPGSEDIVVTGFFGSALILSREGRPVWSVKYPVTEESFLMPPVVTPEGDVCLLSESGHLFYLKKEGDSWKQAWQNKQYSRDISTPLMVQHDYLYAFYDRYGLLVQFSGETGEKIREMQFNQPSTAKRGDELVIGTRAGDSRLFVLTSRIQLSGYGQIELKVLDDQFNILKEIVLGENGHAYEPAPVYPSTSEEVLSNAYPIVEGDTLSLSIIKTTQTSAEVSDTTLERFGVDKDGVMTKVREITANPDFGWGLYALDDIFQDASGRLLGEVGGANEGIFTIQLCIVNGGSIESMFSLSFDLPEGWTVLPNMSFRMDGIWDAKGDYYFYFLVGEPNKPRETRIYRTALGSLPPGTTQVKAELLYTLPTIVLHTNLLMLSDGSLVVGTKDGKIYCFSTDSPGIDPAAPRPVYYQTQSNWGRK